MKKPILFILFHRSISISSAFPFLWVKGKNDLIFVNETNVATTVELCEITACVNKSIN